MRLLWPRHFNPLTTFLCLFGKYFAQCIFVCAKIDTIGHPGELFSNEVSAKIATREMNRKWTSIFMMQIFFVLIKKYFCELIKLPHRDPRDVGGEGLEVVEGGGGVPDDEVDGDEEAAEDDAEAAADDGQEDVLLEEDAVPRPAAAGVRRAAAARSDRDTCNENIFG